jgi:hypothetical protein
MRIGAEKAALVAAALVLFVATLWFLTADVHSEAVRDHGAVTSDHGEPETNCGAAYDAALIAKGTTHGGDPYANQQEIDAQCVDSARGRLLMGGASGVASVACLIGAAVVAPRHARGRASGVNIVTSASE